MPIKIVEPANYESYSTFVDGFQLRMRQQGNDRHDTFSEEREKGKSGVRRFIAENDRALIVGWMTLKIQSDNVKIEGICTDPDKNNSSGASVALITKAVNLSFQLGKGGAVTLFDSSNGTGARLYAYMGFKYVDDQNMRLTVNYSEWDTREVGAVTSKKGNRLSVVEHYRK